MAGVNRCNIGSDMVAAHGQDIGVPNIPADVDRQVGRAAAPVTTAHPFHVQSPSTICHGQWVQLNCEPRCWSLRRTGAGFDRRSGCGDNVRFHFQPEPCMPTGWRMRPASMMNPRWMTWIISLWGIATWAGIRAQLSHIIVTLRIPTTPRLFTDETCRQPGSQGTVDFKAGALSFFVARGWRDCVPSIRCLRIRRRLDPTPKMRKFGRSLRGRPA